MKKYSKNERHQMIVELNKLFPDLKFGRKSGQKLAELLEATKAERPNMSELLARYRPGYVVGLTPSGRKSKRTDDDLALLLEGIEGVAVVQAAEKLLGMKRGTLAQIYEGMNAGQTRMNAGNRIRGAINRGDVVLEEVKKILKIR